MNRILLLATAWLFLGEGLKSCQSEFVWPADNQRTNTTERLQKLRAKMKEHNITAYIIMDKNQHMGGDPMFRLYMTGFSGSGTAVVTMNKSALWTDGRYYTQAKMQLDNNWILMKASEATTPVIYQWLLTELPAKSVVGIDPRVVSISDYQSYEKNLASGDLSIKPVLPNLVDIVWTKDRFVYPNNKVYVLTLNYTGKSWSDKIKDLREKMKAKKAAAVVFYKLDEQAWLFNLRGSDYPTSPLFLVFSIVTKDKAILFIDETKITSSVRKHLRLDSCRSNEVCAEIKPYDKIIDGIKNETINAREKIWVSPFASYGLIMHIKQDKLLSEASPADLPKAIKNPVEIEGMKNAYLKDGVAMCEFFAWMEKEVPKGRKDLTEVSSSKKLEEFKSKQGDYVSPSFTSIVGYGANGAIIHYRPSNSTDVQIKTDSTFLCDSGAQFRDGTTDTTRTYHFGTPTPDEKDAYTRILKGQINLATAVFPNNTKGSYLDVFARRALWENGLDYNHGTGHGIGMFLRIHEGPQRIGARGPKSWEMPIAAGMFTSDEPGYYVVGQYGIRLETVLLTVPAQTPNRFGGKEYLTFEPVALVPYERKLINVNLLTAKEIKWVNDFHRKSRGKLGAEIRRQGKNELYNWLMGKTEIIKVKEADSGSSISSNCAFILFGCVMLVIVNNRH